MKIALFILFGLVWCAFSTILGLPLYIDLIVGVAGAFLILD